MSHSARVPRLLLLAALVAACAAGSRDGDSAGSSAAGAPPATGREIEGTPGNLSTDPVTSSAQPAAVEAPAGAPPETPAVSVKLLQGPVPSEGDAEGDLDQDGGADTPLEDRELADDPLEDDPEDAASAGRMLYLFNCSGCHGETGAGDGETARQLGVQARSFAEGRFSFGNAPEDIFRTLSSGIPGRSVMPGFKGTLSDEERWAIVAHVRTLMPAGEEARVKSTVMEVAGRAVVARGKLPPIAEGAPERPRGLLVGTPEGLTFEYGLEDVRLLGVRQGRFADRTDWNDRGGGYLRPLGQPIYLFNRGQPDATFAQWPESGAPAPLSARLRATETAGGGGALEYTLLDAAGAAVAEVQERVSAEGLSSGAAFTRQLRVRPAGAPLRIAMLVAGSGNADFPRQEDRTLREGWVVSEAHEGMHEAVHLRLPEGARAGSGEFGVYVAFDTTGEVDLRVTVVLTADASEEMLARLAGEVGR